MTWLRFSCRLLFVGGSCGFLPRRGFVFCRNSDKRENSTQGAFITQTTVTGGWKYAFEEDHPVLPAEEKTCWPSQLEQSQRKMPQPEIKYLAREAGDTVSTALAV